MPFTILVIFLFQNNFVFGLTNASYLNGALPLFQIDHGSKPHCKYLTEYFAFLHEFAKMGSNECQFLLRINAISVMVAFFMRHKAQENYVSVRSLGYTFHYWVVDSVSGSYTVLFGSTHCSWVVYYVIGSPHWSWVVYWIFGFFPVLYSIFLCCIHCSWVV